MREDRVILSPNISSIAHGDDLGSCCCSQFTWWCFSNHLKIKQPDYDLADRLLFWIVSSIHKITTSPCFLIMSFYIQSMSRLMCTYKMDLDISYFLVSPLFSRGLKEAMPVNLSIWQSVCPSILCVCRGEGCGEGKEWRQGLYAPACLYTILWPYITCF